MGNFLRRAGQGIRNAAGRVAGAVRGVISRGISSNGASDT